MTVSYRSVVATRFGGAAGAGAGRAAGSAKGVRLGGWPWACEPRMIASNSGSSSGSGNSPPVGSSRSARITGRLPGAFAAGSPETYGSLPRGPPGCGGGVNRSTWWSIVLARSGRRGLEGFDGTGVWAYGAATCTTGADRGARSPGAFGVSPSMARSSCLTMSRQVG